MAPKKKGATAEVEQPKVEGEAAASDGQNATATAKTVAREYVTLTAPDGFKNVACIAVRSRLEALKGRDPLALKVRMEEAVLTVLREEFGLTGEGADLDLIQRDDLKLATRYEVFTTETKPEPKTEGGRARKLDISAIISRAKELLATEFGGDESQKKEAMNRACTENGITPEQLQEMMGFLA